MNRKEAIKLLTLSAIGLCCKKNNMPNPGINKKIILNKGQGNWPEPIVLGTILNDDFTTLSNLNNYAITNPNSTWAITGGFCHTSRTGVVGDFADYMQQTAYGSSSLDNWNQTLDWNISGVQVAGSNGIAIGIKSTCQFSTHEYIVLGQCGVGNAGFVRFYKEGSQVASNLTGMTCSAGDHMTLEIIRTGLVYDVTLYNRTTGSSRTIHYTTISTTTTANLTPTCGQYTIYNIGGTFDLRANVVTSPDYRNADYCFIGDSITVGYRAANIAAGWPAQSMLAVPTKKSLVEACVGGVSGDVLLYMKELLLVNAKTYVLMIGVNDLDNSVTDATFKANYASIVTQLQHNGSRVFHCLITPKNGPDPTSWNTWISTNYLHDVIIDTFTPILGTGYALNATYDSGDHEHPNDAGHALLGTTVGAYL